VRLQVKRVARTPDELVLFFQELPRASPTIAGHVAPHTGQADAILLSAG
jgi:hypothetical protein